MQSLTKISVEEYLEQEAKAEQKSEYHDGEVVAMAGAQEPHNVIVGNLITELGYCLKKYNCRVYPSDLLLKLAKCNKYVYPDITIVCEKPELEHHQGLDVLLNPKVIIEVLSASTSQYDQSEKMRCYLDLESLEEYVMVDSENLHFSTYIKEKEAWKFYINKNVEDKVKIYDCEVLLKDIYRNVSFE